MDIVDDDIDDGIINQVPTTNLQLQHVILFYKFHPLSSDPAMVELYRSALELLCQSLDLQGRILVGCNQHRSEGINGTLSGLQANVQAFTYAMMDYEPSTTRDALLSLMQQEAISNFCDHCRIFYEQAQCPPLIMDESEFKWSTSRNQKLFPDLNIKIVKEMIGTGGVLATIPLEETAQGYLTPHEWHDRLQNLEDTILIDCRNSKEFQIGHFPSALDPETATFHQFPAWVQQHSTTLANKKVLMYCTGGIRCEKASAYIRRQVPSVQEVCHLKGGIHKYLDEFGDTDDCLWKGKNFVFDGRVSAASNQENASKSNNNESIVGSCVYCETPHDTFDSRCVCTVCRELTLVCPTCRDKLVEYHCWNHEPLRHCYFTDLSRFSKLQLQSQLEELRSLMQEIAIGKRYKQKRKTLQKQCDKIIQRMEALESNVETVSTSPELKCRNCGDVGCSGRCWGFHSLKRKRILEEQKQNVHGEQTVKNPKIQNQQSANNKNSQQSKEQQRKQVVDDLIHLQLSQPPSANRDPVTGIRVPLPCTRVLQTTTKGKWCGLPVLQVVQEEFSELAKPDILQPILEHGLLRVNETKVLNTEQAESLRLKNMDTVSRIVHWHEPPVIIPSETISVQKIDLPDVVRSRYGINEGEAATIYVCDKPSSVPVHPAGPYLSNTLTMMVEGQEHLQPRSLTPCHRIDRVTSGLTLCSPDVKVARLIQSRIEEGAVQKLYLAKVQGRFPASSDEASKLRSLTEIAKWSWLDNGGAVRMDAPIETVDPANGIRQITAKGKAAQSLFKSLSYDSSTNTSVISCCPLTGRSHQLRVHLQWLGFPIVNDVQYDGPEESILDKDLGVQRVLESLEHENDERMSTTLSDEDIQAARDICKCCQAKSDGVTASFTDAQLLKSGFSICLHAYRYRIPISPKKKTKTGETDEAEPIAVLDMKVGLPVWAPQVEVSHIQWLLKE